MKGSEYARLLEILERRRLTETELLYFGGSGKDFHLKTYLFSTTDGQVKPNLDKNTIQEIVSGGVIDRYSGIGVAIVTPSFLEDYERFYSINMWKDVVVDDRTAYKHVPDNNLFATKGCDIITFKKASDNLCAIDLEVMGKEVVLWKKVILGKKSLEQYLHEFVKVV